MLLEFRTVALELVLLGTCYLGDHLLRNPVSRERIMVAIVDNLTHGIIGGLSWAIVCDVKVSMTFIKFIH